MDADRRSICELQLFQVPGQGERFAIDGRVFIVMARGWEVEKAKQKSYLIVHEIERPKA
jgi:phosphoribosylamine-glycine ligase